MGGQESGRGEPTAVVAWSTGVRPLGVVEDWSEEHLTPTGGGPPALHPQDVRLLVPTAEWAPAGTAVVLARWACLQRNGLQAVVLRAPSAMTRIVQMEATGRKFRVHVSLLDTCSCRAPDGAKPAWAYVRRRGEWTRYGSVARSVQWLLPQDFAVENKRAERDFLYETAATLWADPLRRGRNVDGDYYPLVDPRFDVATKAVANRHIPSDQHWLREQQVPVQWRTAQHPPNPAPKVWEWPEGKPLPFLKDLARKESDWDKVLQWFEEYQAEWRLVQEGQQRRDV